MATTLVALFDSIRDAEQAREQLQQQVVRAGSVQLRDADSLSAGASSTSREEHRGFFARLFGMDDDHRDVDTYSNAMSSGAAMLTVTLQDGEDASRIESLLEDAGAVNVDERTQQWQGDASNTVGNDTLKVVQEELQVGKRTVETGGVRVRQYVTERPYEEQVSLCEERAVIQRRPVDRIASPDELDLQDREIELRERAEEAVVSKRARVVEEVDIGTEARERVETVQDTLRRTDVDVEQLNAAQQNAQRTQDTNRTQPRR